MPALTNARHEAFAQHVAKGRSADEAYKLAGYSPSRSAASRLSANVNVQDRIAELVSRGADRAEIDIMRTLTELTRIGTADLRRLLKDDGSIKKPSEWDDDLAAAIASIEVVSKGGADQPIEYVHKVKLWDKNSALEKIAKYLGMFIDRIDATVKHSYSELSDDELARELERKLTGRG